MFRKFFTCLTILLIFSILKVNAGEEEKLDLFPLFELENIEGKTVALEDFLGKGPIGISFWATWCKPCLKELDKIQPIYEEYQEKGLEIIAISEDGPRSKKMVPSFIKRKGYTFTVVYDDNKSLQHLLGFADIPELFLLNNKGEIVYHHFGYKSGDENEFKKKMLELLPQESDSTTGSENEGEDCE